MRLGALLGHRDQARLLGLGLLLDAGADRGDLLLQRREPLLLAARAAPGPPARASAADARSVLSCWWRASSALFTAGPPNLTSRNTQHAEVEHLPRQLLAVEVRRLVPGARARRRPRRARLRCRAPRLARALAGGCASSSASATPAPPAVQTSRDQATRRFTPPPRGPGSCARPPSRPAALSACKLLALGVDHARSAARAPRPASSARPRSPRRAASARAPAPRPAPPRARPRPTRRASASAASARARRCCGVGLQPRRLLAVALDARDPLAAHAQVRLPQQPPQDDQHQQEKCRAERRPSRRDR